MDIRTRAIHSKSDPSNAGTKHLGKRDYKLVQDFVVEKGEHSVHILNAVSPAFTGGLPFSRWVVEN